MTDEPLLSVVVPVYQVEPYLPECLDSVLSGTGREVEVIAVDDASPDGCGALLDGYASRDPRVRVVHVATNVGLGRARNTGLAHTRGRYVWFVDSDDWLPAGSVSAVCQRLADTEPDVLLIDHVEVGPGGQVRHQAWPAEVDAAAAPAALAQRPELLRLPLSTSACTKVVRQELLHETGLRFPPGWYEDVAYAYPLLLAAGRIDVLDRVCYSYRRRASDAITTSVSARHFDVFEQYERMWARVDPSDALRPEMFGLMVAHLLVIAGNRHRLPPGRRREFFGQVAAAYRRWRPPAGYGVPGGAAGLKHRLVRRDAYPAYALLRLGWNARQRLGWYARQRLGWWTGGRPRRQRPAPVSEGSHLPDLPIRQNVT